jgi:hypothetical protein
VVCSSNLQKISLEGMFGQRLLHMIFITLRDFYIAVNISPGKEVRCFHSEYPQLKPIDSSVHEQNILSLSAGGSR